MNIGFVNSSNNNNNPNLFHAQQQQQQQQQPNFAYQHANQMQMIHLESDNFNNNNNNSNVNTNAANSTGLTQHPQSPMLHPPQSPMHHPPQSPMIPPPQSPMNPPPQSPMLQPPQSPMIQPPRSPMPPASPHHHLNQHPQHQLQQHHQISHFNQPPQQQFHHQQQQQTTPQNQQQSVSSPLMPPMSPHHAQSSPYSKQQLPPASSPSHFQSTTNQHNFQHPNMLQSQKNSMFPTHNNAPTTPTNQNSNVILPVNNSMSSVTTSPHTISPSPSIISPHHHYPQSNHIHHHLQQQHSHMTHSGHHQNTNNHMLIHHQQGPQQPQLTSPHHLQSMTQQYHSPINNNTNNNNTPGTNSNNNQQSSVPIQSSIPTIASQISSPSSSFIHQNYMVQQQHQQQQNFGHSSSNLTSPISLNPNNSSFNNSNYNAPNIPQSMLINQQQQQPSPHMTQQHFIGNQQQQNHLQQQQQQQPHHINQSQTLLNRMPSMPLQSHGNIIIQPQHQGQNDDQPFSVHPEQQNTRYNSMDTRTNNTNTIKNLKSNPMLSSSNHSHHNHHQQLSSNPNNGEATFFGPNLPNSGQSSENNQSNNANSSGSHSTGMDLINLNQINNLINSPLTEEEEEILGDYDCRLYGLLKLENVEQVFKRYFLIKAILCYEKRIKSLIDEDFNDLNDQRSVVEQQEVIDIAEKQSEESEADKKDESKDSSSFERKKTKYIQAAKLYLSLGHFYLLIYDYSKALECYQKFFKFKLYKLQNSTFYYGLGLIYFIFGAYKYAVRSFLCALYKDNYFQRVNEIHFRLGLIYKELSDFNYSLKHFKLALIDTSSSLSSVTKSEIKLCIAQLHETNNEHFEAIEKYEEIIRLTPNSENDPTNIDSSLKAKAYRHLGWLYFYSDSLNKLTLTTSDEKQIDLVAPLRQELRQQHQQLVKNQIIPKQLNRKSLQLTLEYLSKSAQLDSSQNATWYYYGRALACKGSSREAFISYKNSVNNPEASGDTWCSIGILYYQQKQFMDSLQAFICAIQLDRSHFSAWLNLAILYEQDNQLEEALKCYKTAVKCKLDNKLKQKVRIDLSKAASAVDSTANLSEEYTEEFKQLCERTKLLTNYFSVASDKMKESLKNSHPHVLPVLQEAFSLQIPTELRQKIVNSSQLDQYNIGLGISCSVETDQNSSNGQLSSQSNPTNNTTTSPSTNSLLKPNPSNNRILTNLTANTSPSKIQSIIQQQQSDNHSSGTQVSLTSQMQSNEAPTTKKSKPTNRKSDQLIMLKPAQIQLMNQLDQNRFQLNPDQLQMLTYLKTQFTAMQSHQTLNSANQAHLPKALMNNPHPLARHNTSSILMDTSCSGLNPSMDQLPSDLENIQPSMMNEDTMLQDLNSLLSSQDIVEDLRISDDDKGSLDHIFSFTSNSLSNFLSNANGTHKDVGEDSNSSETSTSFIDKVKLDSSWTNGDNKSDSNAQTKTKSTESEILPMSDDELLASKLTIKMTADEILNECQSYGVNGIQTNSLLKPGRLTKPGVLNKTKKLFFHGSIHHRSSSIGGIGAKKRKDEHYETETKKRKSTEGVENDYDSDDDPSDVDDSLPSGSLGSIKSYLRNNNIKNDDSGLKTAPSVVLETKKDAQSQHLYYFCLSNPISVVRNLGNVLKLDLGLFSSKTLVEVDSEHVVEVRTQRQQPSDENWDLNRTKRVWKCESSRAYTTVLKYAQYQAYSFQEAVKEEKQEKLQSKNTGSIDPHNQSPNKSKKNAFKTIKFGTNVDLSDEKKWKPQMQELAKLPGFMRVVSSANMLSHVGHKIYGVNTLQMYLKVPGSRTPGHQENNNFCSLNLNIGPGDCEWFGCAEKYWPLIESLCEKNDVDYLNGSWWPDLNDLHEAKIPFYRFIQRPGDLVWVNAGCVHWVQSIGWCNAVSWNTGPLVYLQYKLSIERYEWNKLRFYKSIVPMIHLSWNLARNIRITDRRLYEYIRYVLMQSLKQSQLAINYIENCGCELKYQKRQLEEPAHYCFDCECEVFNILFVSEQLEPVTKGQKATGSTQHVVHCQTCARKRNHLLNDFVMLNQFTMDELKQVYNQFQLYVPSLQTTGLSTLA